MTTVFLDTAGTDFWSWKASPRADVQPHLARLAVLRGGGDPPGGFSAVVRPLPRWPGVSDQAAAFHKITTEQMHEKGVALGVVLHNLRAAIPRDVTRIVAHNVAYHRLMLARAHDEAGLPAPDIMLDKDSWYCTMTRSAATVRTRLQSNGQWAWPSLAAAYRHFTGADFVLANEDPAGNGIATVEAVRAVYQGMNP